jgi:hypothetical protein
MALSCLLSARSADVIDKALKTAALRDDKTTAKAVPKCLRQHAKQRKPLV